MFRKRLITSILLIPLIILALFFLPYRDFAIASALILGLAAWEWCGLNNLEKKWQRALYLLILWFIFFNLWHLPFQPILWLGLLWWLLAIFIIIRFAKNKSFTANRLLKALMGLMVLVPCWVGLNVLYEFGPQFVLFVLLVVWAADTGAYLVGSRWGRHKLAAKISPNKSIEGLLGGLGLALIVALVFHIFTKLVINNWLIWLLLVIVLVLFSVVGDLFESVIKRVAEVKDSGSWLPGHGGILDRIDSLTAAAPICALGLLLWQH